jgi:hypothetical protein
LAADIGPGDAASDGRRNHFLRRNHAVHHLGGDGNAHVGVAVVSVKLLGERLQPRVGRPLHSQAQFGDGISIAPRPGRFVSLDERGERLQRRLAGGPSAELLPIEDDRRLREELALLGGEPGIGESNEHFSSHGPARLDILLAADARQAGDVVQPQVLPPRGASRRAGGECGHFVQRVQQRAVVAPGGARERLLVVLPIH